MRKLLSQIRKGRRNTVITLSNNGPVSNQTFRDCRDNGLRHLLSPDRTRPVLFLENGMADAQLFRLPNGDNIVVENDGKVIFDYTPFDGGHRAEEDISVTSLGTLLRAVLLDHGSFETPLRGRGSESPFRDSALSIECFSASGSSASGGVLVPNGKRSPGLLKQEIKNQLLAANIPAEEIEFFGTVHVYVEYLNKSRNPVKTAETFRAKDSYPRRFKSWSDRRKAKQNGRDSAAPQSPEDSIDDIELPKGTTFNIED